MHEKCQSSCKGPAKEFLRKSVFVFQSTQNGL